jgi:hypothetical protein
LGKAWGKHHRERQGKISVCVPLADNCYDKAKHILEAAKEKQVTSDQGKNELLT